MCANSLSDEQRQERLSKKLKELQLTMLPFGNPAVEPGDSLIEQSEEINQLLSTMIGTTVTTKPVIKQVSSAALDLVLGKRPILSAHRELINGEQVERYLVQTPASKHKKWDSSKLSQKKPTAIEIRKLANGDTKITVKAPIGKAHAERGILDETIDYANRHGVKLGYKKFIGQNRRVQGQIVIREEGRPCDSKLNRGDRDEHIVSEDILRNLIGEKDSHAIPNQLLGKAIKYAENKALGMRAFSPDDALLSLDNIDKPVNSPILSALTAGNNPLKKSIDAFLAPTYKGPNAMREKLELMLMAGQTNVGELREVVLKGAMINFLRDNTEIAHITSPDKAADISSDSDKARPRWLNIENMLGFKPSSKEVEPLPPFADKEGGKKPPISERLARLITGTPKDVITKHEAFKEVRPVVDAFHHNVKNGDAKYLASLMYVVNMMQLQGIDTRQVPIAEIEAMAEKLVPSHVSLGLADSPDRANIMEKRLNCSRQLQACGTVLKNAKATRVMVSAPNEIDVISQAPSDDLSRYNNPELDDILREARDEIANNNTIIEMSAREPHMAINEALDQSYEDSDAETLDEDLQEGGKEKQADPSLRDDSVFNVNSPPANSTFWTENSGIEPKEKIRHIKQKIKLGSEGSARFSKLTAHINLNETNPHKSSATFKLGSNYMLPTAKTYEVADDLKKMRERQITRLLSETKDKLSRPSIAEEEKVRLQKLLNYLEAASATPPTKWPFLVLQGETEGRPNNKVVVRVDPELIDMMGPDESYGMLEDLFKTIGFEQSGAMQSIKNMISGKKDGKIGNIDHINKQMNNVVKTQYSHKVDEVCYERTIKAPGQRVDIDEVTHLPKIPMYAGGTQGAEDEPITFTQFVTDTKAAIAADPLFQRIKYDLINSIDHMDAADKSGLLDDIDTIATSEYLKQSECGRGSNVQYYGMCRAHVELLNLSPDTVLEDKEKNMGALTSRVALQSYFFSAYKYELEVDKFKDNRHHDHRAPVFSPILPLRDETRQEFIKDILSKRDAQLSGAENKMAAISQIVTQENMESFLNLAQQSEQGEEIRLPRPSHEIVDDCIRDTVVSTALSSMPKTTDMGFFSTQQLLSMIQNHKDEKLKERLLMFHLSSSKYLQDPNTAKEILGDIKSVSNTNYAAGMIQTAFSSLVTTLNAATGDNAAIQNTFRDTPRAEIVKMVVGHAKEMGLDLTAINKPSVMDATVDACISEVARGQIPKDPISSQEYKNSPAYKDALKVYQAENRSAENAGRSIGR